MTEGTSGIVMPKLGLTMTEGLLAEWLVAPGDEVAAGQLLFVVETDKISNEVEAPAPGRIVSLLVEAGQTVDVGTAIATWTTARSAAADATSDAPPPVAAEPAAKPAPATRPIEQAERSPDRPPRSTPFARRLAKLDGIDIATIAGSGPRGRIQARDVKEAIAALAMPEAVAVAAPAAHSSQRDLRPMIAARVSRSKAEIPHFHVTADVAFDALIAFRSQLNSYPRAPRKLSVTAFIAIAAARALGQLADANVLWRGGRATPLTTTAIGIAVDTPGGVMAPVISATGDLYSFADALDGAVERARLGRIGAGDTGEAALGISNVGMFGVRALTPIIDPDQTFMLGVGAPRGVLRPDADGNPIAVQEVTLSLACDHRAIDGAGAARFLARIVELLEHPAALTIPQG